MPSTYTPLWRVELQATGENRTSWGARGNRSFERIDDGIGGSAEIVMSNQDYTLSTEFGVSDEARMVNLVVGGSMTANRNLIIPTSAKTYNIANETSGGFDLIVTNGLNSFTVRNGGQATLYTDGVDVFSDLDVFDYVNVTAPFSPVASHGYQRWRTGFTLQWAVINAVGFTGTISNIAYPLPFLSSAQRFVTLITGRDATLQSSTASTYTLRHYQRTGSPGGTTGGNFVTTVYMFAVGVT